MLQNALRAWLIFELIATLFGFHSLLKGGADWLLLAPIYFVTQVFAELFIRAGQKNADKYLGSIRSNYPGQFSRILDFAKPFLRSNFFFYCFSKSSQTLSRTFAFWCLLNLIGVALGVWSAINQRSLFFIGASFLFGINWYRACLMTRKMNFPLYLILNVKNGAIVSLFLKDYKRFAVTNFLINNTMVKIFDDKRLLNEQSASNVICSTMQFTIDINNIYSQPGLSSIFEPHDPAIDAEMASLSIANDCSPDQESGKEPTQQHEQLESVGILIKNEYRNLEVCPTVMSMLINVSSAHWELIHRALAQYGTTHLSIEEQEKLSRIVLFFSWLILSRNSELIPQILWSQKDHRELVVDIVTYCRLIVWGETESEKAGIEQIFNDLAKKVQHIDLAKKVQHIDLAKKVQHIDLAKKVQHINQIATSVVVRETAKIIQKQSGASSNNLLLATIQKELHQIVLAIESNISLAILQNLQDDRKLMRG